MLLVFLVLLVVVGLNIWGVAGPGVDVSVGAGVGVGVGPGVGVFVGAGVGVGSPGRGGTQYMGCRWSWC